MKVTTHEQYETLLLDLERWVNAYPDGESPERDAEMRSLAEAIEQYENKLYPMPIVAPKSPKTLRAMMKLKMSEKNMKRGDLAKKLGVSEARLAAVLNGKRKIDLDFAKKLYKKLDIDPKFILDKA